MTFENKIYLTDKKIKEIVSKQREAYHGYPHSDDQRKFLLKQSKALVALLENRQRFQELLDESLS